MQDQTKATFEQKPGQASDPNQEQGKEVQPEYLTRTEVANLLKEQEDRFVERTKGLLNSISDKTQNKVQAALKEYQRAVEAQKAAGIEISPEQDRATKQQIIMEALASEEAAPLEPGTQTPGNAQTGNEPEADPITQEAWRMMEERGVTIQENDPEYRILDMSSPYKFLLSVDKAITAKATRLQQAPSSEEPNQTGSNPLGRIAGAGAGGSGNNTLLPDGTPPIDRLSRHYSQQGK